MIQWTWKALGCSLVNFVLLAPVVQGWESWLVNRPALVLMCAPPSCWRVGWFFCPLSPGFQILALQVVVSEEGVVVYTPFQLILKSSS